MAGTVLNSRIFDNTRNPSEHEPQDIIVGVSGPPVSLLEAAEDLRSVFGEVIVLKAREALEAAQWYFDGTHYDENGVLTLRNPYNLSLDEVAAIWMYTMEFESAFGALYAELNRRLRSDRTNLRAFLKYLRVFLKGFYKLPTRRMHLHRGIRNVVVNNLQMRFWSFTSATPSSQVLQDPQFLGDSGVRIWCNITARATDISHYSEFGLQEDERLIDAGATFEIQGQCDLGNDLCQVQLNQIDDSPPIFDFTATRICMEDLEEKERRRNLERWAITMGWFCGGGLIWTIISLAIICHVFFEATGGDWGHEKDLIFPVVLAAAVCKDDAIYVLGGLTPFDPSEGFPPISTSAKPTKQVQVYSEKFKDWTKSTPMLQSLASHAAVLMECGDFLVVTGGYSESTVEKTAEVHMWDFRGVWLPMANMNDARAGHSISFFKSTVYVVGGDDEGIRVESLQFKGSCQEPGESWWKPEQSMLSQRSHSFATVVLKVRKLKARKHVEILFALGGLTRNVESFDGTQWKPEKALTTWSHSEGINAVTHDGQIFVFGTTVTEVGTWSDKGLHWKMSSQATSFWIPGNLYMAGCKHKHAYWAMGGGGWRSGPDGWYAEPTNQSFSIQLGKAQLNLLRRWLYYLRGQSLPVRSLQHGIVALV